MEARDEHGRMAVALTSIARGACGYDALGLTRVAGLKVGDALAELLKELSTRGNGG